MTVSILAKSLQHWTEGVFLESLSHPVRFQDALQRSRLQQDLRQALDISEKVKKIEIADQAMKGNIGKIECLNPHSTVTPLSCKGDATWAFTSTPFKRSEYRPLNRLALMLRVPSNVVDCIKDIVLPPLRELSGTTLS